MTRFLSWRLCQDKGVQWVQEHIVNFADDFHVSWTGQTEISMHKAVRDMADVLAILKDFCLRINLGKSAAIIRVTGPDLGAVQKHYITRRAGGVYLKRSTRQGRTYHAPIVKGWDYLGAAVSDPFDSDTVRRRVKAADHAFAKLRTVLGRRRSLSLRQRLAVYDACVQSTLLYAILAVGVGAGEAKQVHYMTMRHSRYITHSPRHITHESNEALCRRLGGLPLIGLKQVWERKCRAWTRRRPVLHDQDIMWGTPQYPDIFPTPCSCRQDWGHNARMQNCFHTSHALKTHCARVHQDVVLASTQDRTFQPSRDAVPGSRQCSHCMACFNRCDNLAYHIQSLQCKPTTC